MAILKLLDQGNTIITDVSSIKTFLNSNNIIFEQWEASCALKENDSQETILAAYDHVLKPYMEKHGYLHADVVNIHHTTPHIDELRKKFLFEHTHSEDEVRFFVDGGAEFFFNCGQVFSLICSKGDFISVPKGYKHWFDLAPKYFVKAIRVFQTKAGWVANYTNSGIDKNYNK